MDRFTGVRSTLSYTVYLLHLIILKLLRTQTDWSPTAIATAGLAITLALASASYVWIEGPLARLRRRLH